MWLVTRDCDYEPPLESWLFSTKDGAWTFLTERIRESERDTCVVEDGYSVHYYEPDSEETPSTVYEYRLSS